MVARVVGLYKGALLGEQLVLCSAASLKGQCVCLGLNDLLLLDTQGRVFCGVIRVSVACIRYGHL
jgi:hypothetical protein